MALRPRYVFSGSQQPDWYEEVPDGGDPVADANARLDTSRARQDQLQASAQDSAERERDRQLQFLLARYGQDQQNARLAYTTQADQQSQAQRQAVEARGQDLTAQGFAADRAQRLSPYDMKDPNTGQVVGKLPWSVLEAYGHSAQQEQELGERARQFDTSEERRGYEFGAEQERRAYEFDTNRQPSERDQYEADRRMTEMRAAQEFQAQELQSRYKLQSDLHEQTLSQEEKMRLQRMQTGLAKVQADLDAGRIEPWVADEARSQLQYGISPLKERATREAVLRQQQLDQLHYAQAMKEMHLTQMRGDFESKTFPERIGTWKDENGMVWAGYQEEPGKFKIFDNPYERQAKVEARQAEHFETYRRNAQHDYDSGVKELDRQDNSITTHWNRALSEERRSQEKKIRDAKAAVAKMSPLTKPEERAAAQQKVADQEAALEANLHDALVARGYKWGSSAEEMKSHLLETRQPVEAELKARRDAQLDRFQPPSKPQRPLTPAERIQQQHDQDRFPGGPQQYIPGRGWAPPGQEAPAQSQYGSLPPPTTMNQPATPYGPGAPSPLFPQASRRMAELANEGGPKAEYAAVVRQALSGGKRLSELPMGDQLDFIAAVEELAKTEPELKSLLPLIERLKNAR